MAEFLIEVILLKKFFVLLISLAAILLMGCGGETAEKTEPATNNVSAMPAQKVGNSKILVAYFSRAGDNFEVGVIEKGNTKIVAEMIAEKTGADMFEIQPLKAYPADYRECTEVAKQEQSENARPEIVALVGNLSDYDTIFLGYPIWWSDFPMFIYTFMEKQDFSGKTIIPFCTSGGEYMTGNESEIPSIARGSKVLKGIGIRGKDCQNKPDAVREKVNAWLAGLGY